MPHDANSGKYPKCFITVSYTALDLPAPRYVEKIIPSPKLSKIDSVIHTENLSAKRCFHYCGKAYTKPDIQTDRQTLSPVSAK